MVRLGREVQSLGAPIDVVVLSEANVENTIVHAALTEGREFAAV